MVELEFNEKRHEYRLAGRILPSVTQVLELLENFKGVPPIVLEAARIFGAHVHKACDLDDRGILDTRVLDPALVPYLEGWRRFRRESGFEILSSEERVVHAQLGYAGTLDRRALYRKRLAVLDIKSGEMPPTVGPQVAAYAEAWAAMTGARAQRFCVQLNPEFPHGYKLHALREITDWSYFLSALNCWRFKHAS